jgi:hypothetical protein
VAAEATRRVGMVAVTERARERLLEMKASASITEPEVGFRLKLAANDHCGRELKRRSRGLQSGTTLG